MIVADTNVWARAFLGDDPQPPPRARRALAAARSKEGVFVPLVVMAELSWVLRGARWDRARVSPDGSCSPPVRLAAGRSPDPSPVPADAQPE